MQNTARADLARKHVKASLTPACDFFARTTTWNGSAMGASVGADGGQADVARRRWPRVAAALVAHWRVLLLSVAVVLGGTGRIAYGWGAPFWFDETFSGVIASQPSVASLVAWCLSEVTGPAFYMPLWAWAQFAGSSDAALRAPSLVLSFAAPLLILWNGSRDRDVALFWTVVTLLWVPSFVVAAEARGYPQLFFLGTAQAIAFVALIERPGTRRALAWTALSAVAVLSHYYAAIPAAVQGVAYLVVHRRRAVRTWPALAALLPVAGWMAWHLPMLRYYATAHDAAYAPLPLSALASLPVYLFGAPLHGTIVLGTVVVASLIAVRRTGVSAVPSAATILSCCAVVSVAIPLTLGFFRPGFAPRYLTPAMPGLLFGLAVWARHMMRVDAKPVIVVMATMTIMTAGVIGSSLGEPDRDPRHLFNLEQPSTWLGEARPNRLVLLWDGPIGAASGAAHLAEVGGFFFRRAGHPVAVELARVGPQQDPNRVVLTLAGSAPDTAILWMANDLLPARRRPQLPRYDAALSCRDFGEGVVTMTACRRRTVAR